ncbi:14-3-3 protein zeta-like [Teleopsis dalmanni]|uniref:14-3-3 protein zeta-like n=1 Tax=Teleopsis dalmanni TaxID=139649 RepID=UPI0018CEB48C|nr:14-3-3 protein zeta-like [Teleopsis dalmanni]
MDSNNSEKKNELISKIVVANLIKNYEEMAKAVHDLIQSYPQLNEEELNWLSVAYKHCVHSRISSWHVVKSALDKEKAVNNILNVYKAENLLKDIETEIRTYCTDILDMLEDKIMMAVTDDSIMVSCWKLKGDHRRFQSEIETGERKSNMIMQSENAYEEGYRLATSKLEVNSPVFLALVLNYSLFLHETVKNKKKAMQIAMTARESIDLVKNTQPNIESAYILERLNDNMRQWDQNYLTNRPSYINPFHGLF